MSHLAHLGSSLQNPQDARSHMTAPKERQRHIVMMHPENDRKPQGRRKGGNTFPIGDVPTVNTGNRSLLGSKGVRCLALCLWPCGGCLHGSKINHTCHTRVSGDEPRGWEAVRFYSPSPHYRDLGHAILTFLKPGLILPFEGGGPLPRMVQLENVCKWDSSPHRTTQNLITRT